MSGAIRAGILRSSRYAFCATFWPAASGSRSSAFARAPRVLWLGSRDGCYSEKCPLNTLRFAFEIAECISLERACVAARPGVGDLRESVTRSGIASLDRFASRVEVVNRRGQDGVATVESDGSGARVRSGSTRGGL